jgi:general secretion pathway protein D
MQIRERIYHSLWTACFVFFLLQVHASDGTVANAATDPSAPAQSGIDHSPTTAPASDPLITLNLPEDVELKTLVDYVSQRLGFNVIYDDSINNLRVTLKIPTPIPRSSLIGLLDSALRAKGFTLADGEQPGWKRVAASVNLAAIAQPTTQPGGISAVVRVFSLKSADATRVDQTIKPFLTQPGGSSSAIPEQGLLIVTDYASNMKRLEDLVRLIDVPGPDVVIQFVPIVNTDATQLATELAAVLAAQNQASSTAASGTALPADKVEVSADARTNRIALVGTPQRVAEVVQLIHSMDQKPSAQTRAYALTYASPERLDKLVRDLLGPDGRRIYSSAIDRDGGLLVVTAPPDVQARVQTLKTAMDHPQTEDRSPIRFYKLDNATAADVLDTIRGIEGENDDNDSDQSQGPPSQHNSLMSPISANGPGGNSQPVSANGQAGGFATGIAPLGGSAGGSLLPAPTGAGLVPQAPSESSAQTSSADRGQSRIQSVHTRFGTVTADVNTNSIIVVGDPQQQQFYAQLIPVLDKRRPQVLIEATIVSLNTSHNFNFGVEIGVDSQSGATKLLNFSSFGLSTVNATNGQLAITPGTGFNGTILNSSVASAVLQALAADSRARVLSSPRLLVNDNADGTLNSTDNIPYSSINASNTVSTTSLGGTVSAGTIIKVTPHISEGDHLSLHYDVTLSSFNGTASNGLPPPTLQNELSSDVTIPDGDTIVVGGLKTSNRTYTRNAIPILGELPIIQYLFSDRQIASADTTLFVFIRPIILRDDEFRDLKFQSERDVRQASLPGDYPSSEPLAIR